jgi:flagellar protein FliO/FliZ
MKVQSVKKIAMLCCLWAWPTQRLLWAADAIGFNPSSTSLVAGDTPGTGRMLLSLLAVVGLLLALAWLAKRYTGIAQTNGQRLRVITHIALGSRERAVLIALDGREMLLGVSAGGVRTLLSSDAATADGNPAIGADMRGGTPSFKATLSDILKRSLGR